MTKYLFTDQPRFSTAGLKVCSLEPDLVHDAAEIIGGGNAYPKKDDVLLIDIFLTFKDPEYQRQQDLGGIALLKFLRIKGVKNHIVLLSPWNLPQLLRMDPAYHIIGSLGVTVAKFTYALDELCGHDAKPLNLATLASEEAPEDRRLREYFKASISLPKDERHNWAQWWGAECMRLMHNKFYNDDQDQDIPCPPSVRAKLKELKCAQLMFVYSSAQISYDNPNLTENPLSSDKKVLYVDDNCDMGWKEVLSSFIYGSVFEPKDIGQGVYQNGSLVSMKPFGGEDREVFYQSVLTRLNNTSWNPQTNKHENVHAFVVLDVRLFAEPHDTPDTKLSGIELLRKIRSAYPALPVVLFTATARADFFKAFEKIGLVGHWTKPSPEDSGKEDHLTRSYSRLRRLLTDVAKQTQDPFGVNFAATDNMIDQINSRIFGNPDDFSDYDALVAKCPWHWLEFDHVTVDTNFLEHIDIHKVLPALYFISLARSRNGKVPINVIDHVFDELTYHQSQAAKNGIKLDLGRRASFVLPIIVSWMAEKRMARYRYSHEDRATGRKFGDAERIVGKQVCNEKGIYFRAGKGLVADDILVSEFVSELKEGKTVVLFSNEAPDKTENVEESQKLPDRMLKDLNDEEKKRFSYVQIKDLKSVTKAIDKQLSNLSY